MAWYKCNITHDVRQEDGSMKADVTESHVFEVQSVTEAAARLAAYFEYEKYTLEGITRMRLQEAFMEEFRWVGYSYFLAKVTLTTLDEESDSERRQTFRYLIEAETLKEAMQRLEEEFRGTVSKWELISLSKTPIERVYPIERKMEGTA